MKRSVSALLRPLKSYLNMPAIISAAEITARWRSIRFGFLSEDANFAEQVERSGFVRRAESRHHSPDGRQSIRNRGR
ncbi:biotin carboxylase N-terminal domain-containing protein [Shigella flexneri]